MSTPNTNTITHSLLCNVDEFIHWTEIVCIIVSTICLIIILVVAVISIKNIVKSNPIKNLYYVTLTSCLLILTTHILETILCNFVHAAVTSILRTVFTISYYIHYMAILGNLILRLKYSFNDSIYALSQKQLIMFAVLYGITVKSALMVSILYILTEFGIGDSDCIVAKLVFSVICINIVLYFPIFCVYHIIICW